MLKLGDKGLAVKELQRILKIKITGYFDTETEKAVIQFQKSKGLKADGVVGPKTAKALNLNIETFLSTDISNSFPIIKFDNIIINKFYLDKDEYNQGNFEKDWIILHHTAGNHDPFKTIKIWNDDHRGKIATQFVIGGISITNGDSSMDGVIVESFPDGSWAHHIGINGNANLHPKSIGIEICNYGPLDKGKDGKFRNYIGHIVPDSMVCDLGFKFRDKQFYHNYTDRQIDALYNLILEIKRRNPKLNIKEGLCNWLKTETALNAFEYKAEAFFGKVKGILSHSNIRKDKSDVYPHPKLIQMLKQL